MNSALIGPDHGRIAAEVAHRFRDVGHALPVDAAGDRDLHGLLGAVVDHSQTLDRPAVGQGVEHEVHRPVVVRTGRGVQRSAFDRDALALAPCLRTTSLSGRTTSPRFERPGTLQRGARRQGRVGIHSR